MDAQVSWDLVMSEDMAFIEGCYRLGNEPWRVVIAFKRPGVARPEVLDDLRWESGVTGMNVLFPEAATVNADVLLAVMSSHLGVSAWSEVRGPDSIMLR